MSLLPIELVSLSGDQLVTDSRRVAQHFSKDHKSVLRSIDRLDCTADFRRRNFAQTVEHRRNPSGGRPIASRVVTMTKDGFMFLAMGYGGHEAALIKEAYINAFNTMAEQLERRDLSLMRRLLDHELRDKDSKQRGSFAGKMLKTRSTEKRHLINEERALRVEAQPALFQLVKGGS
ncbi:Rha family transcriptional regulator [Paucibacter sp. O1-1]|nr:Rha family transcriptional regulator [Paucibacter sp. O1-1]MDA3827869.1 Rha family transcriptional regulator [Paucibacter sp. O1-1]